MTLAPGQSLGRYRLEESLGRGGMAEVYRARDQELGREVAVKVILPELGAETRFLERFRREARMVAALEHPNVLPIYDVGEHDGRPFVVMPVVRGGTLADRLDALRAAGRTLPLARVLDWGGQLAAALDAAHAAGILHRDVKPGNVLLGDDGRLFLADFGIARLTDAATRLTHTGMVVGTPLYMAPEVAAGGSAGRASDLYSLAVLLYEMMAGKPPFEGENVLSILHQHATRPAPPLTRWVDGLPPSLDRAMARGLAKRPGERPASCAAFVESLRSGSFDTLPVSDTARTLPLPPATGADETGSPPVAVTPPSVAATELRSTGSAAPVRAWGAAGLVGALVAVAGFVVLQVWGPAADRVPPLPAEGVELAARPSPEAAAPEVAEPEAADVPASTADEDPAPVEVSATLPVVHAPPEPEGAPDSRDVEGEARTSDPPAPALPPRPRPGEAVLKALRSLGPGFDEIRRWRSRSSAEDFRRILDRVRAAGERDAPPGPAEAIALYAEGGLAYVAGDRDKASAALRELVGEPRFLIFWGPGPLTLLAPEAGKATFDDRELALGYVDPKHELAAALDRHAGTAASDDPRWRLVRALVHRLDGEPRQVIEEAEPVWPRLGAEVTAEARAYVAQVLAEAYRDLGQTADALHWFRRAVEAGGIHLGTVAVAAAEVARELGRDRDAAELMRSACQAGHPAACRELRRPGRRLPARRPG